MAVFEITENIYSVGAVDWDRRLFDELIPLPDGTTYNSFLLKGDEKTALIDAVDPTKKDVLFENLKKINFEGLDYIISNHAEQDHSGTIPDLLKAYPDSTVITNEKCKDLLIEMLEISEEKIDIVQEGDEISLGDLTLKFKMIPWVHWPDTMLEYVPERDIMFTCDYLGSHYATSKLFIDDYKEVEDAAKRYYAEIMMPFRNKARENLSKVKESEPNILAPSHGPIYNKPESIISSYEKWTSKQVENKVIIPYVSMHGSVQGIVDNLVDLLIDRGIEVKPFRLTKTDTGNLAMEMVDAATIILGSPMVLGGAHPKVIYGSLLAGALNPKTRYLSVVGSYGWGGRLVDQLTEFVGKLDADVLDPVIIKGRAGKSDIEELKRLANDIEKKHKNDENVN